MLQLIDITLRRGESLLFDGLNLTVHAGHKAGIVGRNGIGKSTLFEVVRHRLLPEEGEAVWPDSWRLACLEQTVAPSERSAVDFVLDGDRRLRAAERAIAKAEADGDHEALGHLYARLEDAGGYDAHARAAEILGGLGFAAGEFDKPHRAFSGGWRIRAHLARALMAPSDLLLLDEPTNHLDLDATLWLENWVRRYQGTLLLIAHDRDFLDRSMSEIVHLENGGATSYAGNYSAFERQRAETLERQAAVYKKQQLRVAEIHAFVDRFRAKASKARQAQSRLKELERMDLVAPVHAELPYRFAFTQPKKISNPTLMLDEAAIGYDGEAVLEDVTLRVYPGDRIGVLGANGAGKTTLLRCLAGELEPLAGSAGAGRHASVGYFAQHQLESLDLDLSPLAQVEELAATDADVPRWTDQQARDYLGGWGFGGDDVTRPARTFSGGEKARLVLALLACRSPAVLVLDEPTNHLDLDMRQALALALQDYRGALLLVSHDRHLLRQCADDFWLVADATVTRFADDLDAYTALRRPRSSGAGRRGKPSGARRSRRNHAALAREQTRLDARLTELSKRLEAIDFDLAQPGVHRQPDELARLASARRELTGEVERAEEAWLALQSELDAAGPDSPTAP